MKKILFIPLFALLSVLSQAQSNLLNTDNISIPYKKFTLDNGLTLLVHEDHKAPIAAVNVWYHVGSKNERLGKSGFAHLFEHLMFNGSEHFNNDYFKALESIGATDLNGTTNNDRTNYFQNIPLAALDQVLWLESDRMGHLLGVIDQPRLDEQRGVVQNEKRQGENQPYGREDELSTKAIFPAGHPYSWTVIGSMEDLNAASLEDVKDWFKSYYGPDNAVLVVAGDVSADAIFQKVKTYFGNIPAGPTLSRYTASVPKLRNNIRQSYEDRVSEARISMYWNVPQWGTKEAAQLDLSAAILSNGKSSRLYKKLRYEDQTVGTVYANNYSMEISGVFNVTANVKQGVDHAKVEATMNSILNEFIDKGPTEEELQRVKSEYLANFIKGLERIGGFGGKSDVLAESQVYGKDPEYYKTYLKYIANATVQDVHQVVKEWLTGGSYTLICTPFPNYQTSGVEADRSKVPALTTQPASSFPDIQTASLKNGLKIILAKRKDVPTVALDLMVDAGYAADQFAKPGTSSLTMNLLDEGTKSLNALQISDKLQTLGSSLNTFSDLDVSYVRMNALKPSLDESLNLFADVILNPGFSESDFQRLKQDQINNIRRERTQPVQMALRVFPKFLYGDGHAYSQPLTGSGYEETVDKFTREDILKFYSTWFKPNNSTLVVVGDLEMKDLVAKAEKLFGQWKRADVPKKNVANVTNTKANKLYLMDRPESQQSVIIAGYVTEPYGKINELARESLMSTLGGDFVSRLNMNLREDKHWAYGAFSFLWDSKGQRMMLAYAPVQTDKTKESAQEIINEFKAIVGNKPVTEDEFTRTKNNGILQLPGRWETNAAVRGSIDEIVKYGLPDDYFKNYDKNFRSLTLDEVRKLTPKLIAPSNLTWFVVGDKSKVLDGLKQLGFNEIVLIDADGKPMQPSSEVKTGNKN
ncbi:MAG TPA: peptidase M16 [Cytophagales bacterium]|nr:peptidase M16 [Cytophagales bacterium]